MRNKMFNRLLAGALAGTMVLGMSVTVLAAEGDQVTTGNVEGTGEFEGHVEKSVLAVTLPTNVPATTFAYTMDPEGLIAATEGAKNTSATFEDGANVYFLSAENTYTKNSAKLKVINVGSVDADVTIKAETAVNNDVTMAVDDTFATPGKNLYLGLEVANKSAVAVKAAGDSSPAEVTVGLKGIPDNFEVIYENNAYGYKSKDGIAPTAWNSFEFGLTGACDAKGDWSAEDLTAPDVTVTWSYTKREADSSADMLDENATTDEAPALVGDSFTMTAGQAFEVPVNLGVGTLKATGIASVSFERDGSDVLVGTARYSFADNKITFESSWVDSQLAGITASRTYKVTFNDAAKTVKTFTVTK